MSKNFNGHFHYYVSSDDYSLFFTFDKDAQIFCNFLIAYVPALKEAGIHDMNIRDKNRTFFEEFWEAYQLINQLSDEE
mgnify:CR=1 FL=1